MIFMPSQPLHPLIWSTSPDVRGLKGLRHPLENVDGKKKSLVRVKKNKNKAYTY